MRSFGICILLILLTLSKSLAQEGNDKYLNVFGKVKIFATADRAKILFTIKGVGSSLKFAFDDAKTKMQSISTRFNEIGLSEKNISTSFFESSENYGDKAFLSSKKDYRAIMTVTVATDSLELLEQIIIIISEGDVEKIKEVTFELNNFFELKRNGLEKAIKKAKEKAEIMAKELGIKYGRVLELEEIPTSVPEVESVRSYKYIPPQPFNAPYYALRSYLAEDRSIYSQEMTFYIEVRVKFEILESDHIKE